VRVTDNGAPSSLDDFETITVTVNKRTTTTSLTLIPASVQLGQPSAIT
jgi:hypothetical protein